MLLQVLQIEEAQPPRERHLVENDVQDELDLRIVIGAMLAGMTADRPAIQRQVVDRRGALLRRISIVQLDLHDSFTSLALSTLSSMAPIYFTISFLSNKKACGVFVAPYCGYIFCPSSNK